MLRFMGRKVANTVYFEVNEKYCYAAMTHAIVLAVGPHFNLYPEMVHAEQRYFRADNNQEETESLFTIFLKRHWKNLLLKGVEVVQLPAIKLAFRSSGAPSVDSNFKDVLRNRADNYNCNL